MQIIFVTESDPKAQVDDTYIRALWRQAYSFYDRKVKITFLNMKGKSNYRSMVKRIENEIRSYAKPKFPGDRSSYVIYCVDTDEGGEASAINDDIASFCAANNYRLSWFHRDVEEVFLGRRVSDSEKKSVSMNFLREQGIKELDLDVLSLHSKPVGKPYGKSNLKAEIDAVVAMLLK